MSLLNKIVLEGLSEIVKQTIIVCGDLYNFDAREAMSKISLDDVLSKSSSLVSSNEEEVREVVREVEKKEKKAEKAEKSEKAEKVEKSEIRMPYSGEYNPECCNGLKHNLGLYTQCKIKRKGSEKYCKMCESQAAKHSHGKPTYGTIEDRKAVGIMEFVDPSGKKPELYMNVLKKINVTIDEAIDEAKKQHIQINEVHFEEEVVKMVAEKTSEKSKGRPKKSKKVLEVVNDEDDLITSLLVASTKAKQTETAAAVKVNEDTEKKKKAEKSKKEGEIEAKKEAERKKKEEAEIEAKKEAERKQQEEAERKQQEEAERKKKEEAEKQKKEESSGTKVKRVSYKDGKTYLRSMSTGIVYNTDSVEVGKWNEVTQEIDFNENDDELEEEEYLEDLNNDNEEEEEEEEEQEEEEEDD